MYVTRYFWYCQFAIDVAGRPGVELWGALGVNYCTGVFLRAFCFAAFARIADD